MKLLLKGQPIFKCLPPEYRGIAREFPCYAFEAEKNHPANQAYFLYLELRDNDGFLHDITGAREIVKAYEGLTPPESYEIIEVTENKESPESVENLFLGYDLAYGGDSLVAAIISQYRELNEPSRIKGFPRYVLLFDRLIAEHFKPKLNKYLLFDSYETAEFCLECMMSIFELEPQFYEPGEYIVVGVYKVNADRI
jgi:hypothetical protein